MLEVRNLSYSWGRRPVLRDVSFVVSPGETVSVVGANGSGKSTLLRILATLAEPDSGKVLSDGQDIFDHSLRYRRQLGYLSDQTPLYDDMTVRKYLIYRAQLKGEPPRRIRRRLGEASEICRLSVETMCAPIERLSFGERRRVALADALLLRPRVLLLDNFLSGLDCGLRETAGQVLSEAAAFSSVIVTGHEIAEMSRWSTRFLVLGGGMLSATVPAAGVPPEQLAARVGEALREIAE